MFNFGKPDQDHKDNSLFVAHLEMIKWAIANVNLDSPSAHMQDAKNRKAIEAMSPKEISRLFEACLAFQLQPILQEIERTLITIDEGGAHFRQISIADAWQLFQEVIEKNGRPAKGNRIQTGFYEAFFQATLERRGMADKPSDYPITRAIDLQPDAGEAE